MRYSRIGLRRGQYARPNRAARAAWAVPISSSASSSAVASPSNTVDDSSSENVPSHGNGGLDGGSDDKDGGNGDEGNNDDGNDENDDDDDNGDGDGDGDGDISSSTISTDADVEVKSREVMVDDERARLLADVAPRAGDAASNASTEALRLLSRAVHTPLIGGIARQWPALRNRLGANAALPVQLGVEICVGAFTKTAAEVQSRGKRFWKEFDFYLSDLALEIFGDAMLVWLLCPVVPLVKRTGFLAGLPRHAGQIGQFGLGQRVAGYVYKGVQFGVVGFASSVVGHSLTRELVRWRDGDVKHGEGETELAPVMSTSLAWGGFMMMSSNARYQVVNGIEQRVLATALGGRTALLTGTTFLVRLGNCYVGSLHWIPWARMCNLQ